MIYSIIPFSAPFPPCRCSWKMSANDQKSAQECKLSPLCASPQGFLKTAAFSEHGCTTGRHTFSIIFDCNSVVFWVNLNLNVLRLVNAVCSHSVIGCIHQNFIENLAGRLLVRGSQAELRLQHLVETRNILHFAFYQANSIIIHPKIVCLCLNTSNVRVWTDENVLKLVELDVTTPEKQINKL